MLDIIKNKISTGEEWEELCNSCYRIRYQNEGYQEIPASYKGDGGIEGFTKTGIVYQCYFLEKEYSTDEEYNHMRDKMTKDINKLISPDYEKVLTGMGINNVVEWHFVVPSYRDRRILEHAHKKKQEVLKAKNDQKLSYISDEFDITIKVAEDFKLEISRMSRLGLKDVDLLTLKSDKVDWSDCESEKVGNVKRKVKAVMGFDDEQDEDFRYLVDTFMTAYVSGIELMERLRKEQNDIFEQIMQLERIYKREVSVRTKMNRDSSMNYQLFSELLDNFERKLGEACPFLTNETVSELKFEMVSNWLADCSMQFRIDTK